MNLCSILLHQLHEAQWQQEASSKKMASGWKMRKILCGNIALWSMKEEQLNFLWNKQMSLEAALWGKLMKQWELRCRRLIVWWTASPNSTKPHWWEWCQWMVWWRSRVLEWTQDSQEGVEVEELEGEAGVGEDLGTDSTSWCYDIFYHCDFHFLWCIFTSTVCSWPVDAWWRTERVRKSCQFKSKLNLSNIRGPCPKRTGKPKSLSSLFQDL